MRLLRRRSDRVSTGPSQPVFKTAADDTESPPLQTPRRPILNRAKKILSSLNCFKRPNVVDDEHFFPRNPEIAEPDSAVASTRPINALADIEISDWA